MEAYLNDKEDDFLDNNQRVVWSVSPLYNNNNNIDVSDYSESHRKCTKSSHNSVANSPRINVEYDTESGYFETLCSEFSSSSHSLSSYVSCYSDADEECDLCLGMSDGMRKTNLVICSGSDRESLTINSNSSQIVSLKGTVRGVKNRVRDNILHFLSDSSEVRKKDEDFKELDSEHGKVIIYTTSLGLIRKTQDECNYVKRIFHNLMVQTDERDLFLNPQFKEELQSRLNGEEIKLPKVFINGKLIGGAKEVENLIESGCMKDCLEKIKRVSHGEPCNSCGGRRFINCIKCFGSGKSRKTRISREINSLRCSSCTNGIVACSDCSKLLSSSDG